MTDNLPDDKGTYVIVMRSATSGRIKVGARGFLSVRSGFYLYVGSAFGPGGLKARIGRHKRRNKALRWHIDYLRQHTQLIDAWTFAKSTPMEHRWAGQLAQLPGIAMPGFGSSDCNCASHLFFTADESQLPAIRDALVCRRGDDD